MANSLRVLVVEDDQSIQSLVEEALADGGFESSIASSGEGALSLLRQGKYDVLVLDIKLGADGIKGWHVARRAKALNPGLPVIYMTGGTAEEWTVHGVANSIILAKPFVPAQLISAISNLLTPPCAADLGGTTALEEKMLVRETQGE
jgi:DNA-binding response OmpR family regulator